MPAIIQPLPCRIPDIRWSSLVHPFKVLLDKNRIAGIELTFCQHSRLAGETTNSFEASDRVSVDRHDHAFEFLSVRPLSQKFLKNLVHGRRSHFRRLTGIQFD